MEIYCMVKMVFQGHLYLKLVFFTLKSVEKMRYFLICSYIESKLEVY